MRVLVIGANGQVGREVVERLLPIESITLQLLTRDKLDLTKTHLIQQILDKYDIDCLINCSAYTAVDKAEEEQNVADAINHLAVKEMALWAKNNKIPLIHLSTDYVFDGDATKAYIEEDTPNPITVYGKTKLLGEQAILESGTKAIILRVSWVFGRYGNNFVKTILSLAKTKTELSIVADQIGCP